MKLPTATQLARKTGHGKRLTEYRLKGQRSVKASTLLSYLDALTSEDDLDEDRARLALELLEHFGALEGQTVLSFPPGNDTDEVRQEIALASGAELRWGQMPGHGNAYQVLCSCPGLARAGGVVRTFSRRDQAVGYWRHLRHLRLTGGDELLDGAANALVDDDTPAAKPKRKGRKPKSKPAGGGTASDSDAVAPSSDS